MSDVAFLLWSNKHRMWWRAASRGYSPDMNDAGRYTEAEALDRVLQSAFHGAVDQVTCMVVAPEELAGVWADTGVDRV